MASSISEAQAELINSLSPDDIPIKLRCAICSKLAVNSFRLPCCEQAICEPCQTNLPSSCPVCEHSPLSAEDCNPNKSLRTTIKVFLRTAEKKREASRPKEPTPAPPVEVTQAAVSSKQSSATIAQPDEDTNDGAREEQADKGATDDPVPESMQQGQQVTRFNGTDMTERNENSDPTSNALGAGGDDEGQNANDDEDEAMNDESGQAGNDQENYGSESMNGGMLNMAFSGSGDMNQMQMMMAMQNGMGPNSFGNFPMMGMPGMGMDPMAMQNMYMNGGFQGMGMNGMGGGFGGGFGQGSNNNNWNGSQMWNFDQSNYNHQNGIGMGTGDFGNFNSGFQTGYNQGNYGHFNDYRRNNFGRGRGRGRGYYGGYGRGGYQYHGTSNYQDQGSGQYSQQAGHGPPGQAQAQAQAQAQIEAQGDASDVANRPENGAKQDQGHGEDQRAPEGNNVRDSKDQSDEHSSRDTLPNEATGDVTRQGDPGAIRSVLSAPDVPLNAPTGPKAMRQGLPNTSLHHLRARGFQIDGETPQQLSLSMPQPPSGPAAGMVGAKGSPAGKDDKDAAFADTRDKEDQVKDYERDERGDDPDSQSHSRYRSRSRSERSTKSHSRTRSRSRSRSRSHSQSRGHKSSHRRRRQRSESVNDDDYDNSHRRKKHRSSRRHYDDDDDQYYSKESKHAERSRSASPDDSKRSSRRSHRDRDYESRRDRDKDRDKDKDKSRDDARQKSSSHRSHRDREHDSSRHRDRDRERERRDRRERHRDNRDRDKEDDYKNGSSTSRRGSSDGRSTPAEQASAARGSSSRTHEKSSREKDSKSSTPVVDPHTLEREARNRERLLKEAQRMAGLASSSGSKRSRDDGVDESVSRKGRRSGRRSEARDGGNEEERMRRLEAEREGGRWG